MTSPPCQEGVLWTIPRQALPISPKYADLINGRFSGMKSYAVGNGNNRILQEANKDHKVHYQGAVAMTLGLTAALMSLALQ